MIYFVSSLLFILGLRGLTHPTTARRGTILAAVGMLMAVIGTLLHHDIVTYRWIIAALIAGTLIGIPMGLWIPMTKMPERIALSHSFGGLAVALVGIAEYYHHISQGLALSGFAMGAVGFEVLLGSITFTGSLIAFGKLQGILPGHPLTFKGQNGVTLTGVAVAVAMAVFMIFSPSSAAVFYSLAALGFLLGISLVIPIGGADMPVVICLLNSYAGLAAAAAGLALQNNILVICGALDGGSGFILAMLMSKAMNRSFRNVLFGAVGALPAGAAAGAPAASAPVHEASPEEAAELLKGASSVIFVPGYGMAVAQAQHAVHELETLLAGHGAKVRYAIHPVAGRMPGHMNVLLAEANVPYDLLFEMDAINDDFPETDVAVVVGANDVVNPAARTKKGSPLFGMPILNVDKAKAVLVCKRSLRPGFAGEDNDLFYRENTLMVFGDAKATMTHLAGLLKGDSSIG